MMKAEPLPEEFGKICARGALVPSFEQERIKAETPAFDEICSERIVNERSSEWEAHPCEANRQPALPLNQVLADDGGAGFDKVLLRFIEGAGKIAFDIEFRCEVAFHEDRDNNFAVHHRRSRKIPRVFGNIVHDYTLPGGCRSAAESAVEGNAGIGRKAANEGPHQQNAGVRRVDEIKTHPVVARHFFMETLGHTFHQGLRRWSGPGKVLKFREQFLVGIHRVVIVTSASRSMTVV